MGCYWFLLERDKESLVMSVEKKCNSAREKSTCTQKCIPELFPKTTFIDRIFDDVPVLA